MDVIVHGRNVPPTLRTAARRKLGRLERMARDLARAEVDFSEERNPRIARRHRCAVVVEGRREFFIARAAAPQPEAALDLAVGKLRHQVSRHHKL
jgi:ribosomal subunit interface protein